MQEKKKTLREYLSWRQDRQMTLDELEQLLGECPFPKTRTRFTQRLFWGKKVEKVVTTYKSNVIVRFERKIDGPVQTEYANTIITIFADSDDGREERNITVPEHIRKLCAHHNILGKHPLPHPLMVKPPVPTWIGLDGDGYNASVSTAPRFRWEVVEELEELARSLRRL